jgi:hypothetical protein
MNHILIEIIINIFINISISILIIFSKSAKIKSSKKKVNFLTIYHEWQIKASLYIINLVNVY